MGYLEGNVTAVLSYNASTAPVTQEAEELHMMIIAGNNVSASAQAIIPSHNRQVVLAATGLDGSVKVDLLLRFYPRNANVYGCTGFAPHQLLGAR